MRSQGLELFIYSSSRHATKVFAFFFLKKSPLVPLLSKGGSYRSREKNSQIRFAKELQFSVPFSEKEGEGRFWTISRLRTQEYIPRQSGDVVVAHRQLCGTQYHLFSSFNERCGGVRRAFGLADGSTVSLSDHVLSCGRLEPIDPEFGVLGMRCLLQNRIDIG